ncbi:hypothetical protein IC757_11560 [Wenzhouxiangella sp. AB-CW3]|uniref:hypothetical protein n=1 Tax=Wenzhouxiangella sp. AB-CW3 TaxID=2771012 RepID=UPI00168A4D67|nr:hypothetical protein [Wenzhouxiangella sp. AB-CW3]QOC21675.1 hypothetical protein IC757_11560 [Wenzhouxiangella sp. AB-CW3]
MKSRVTMVLTGVALVLATAIPGAALAERPSFVSPGADAAMIHGGSGEARDIYAIEFIAIDGQRIEPRDALWLEPGEYELEVRISGRPLPRTLTLRSRGEDGFNRITVELEAGKRYDIRAHHDRHDTRRPYTVILHNVTDHGFAR